MAKINDNGLHKHKQTVSSTVKTIKWTLKSAQISTESYKSTIVKTFNAVTATRISNEVNLVHTRST